MRITSLLIALTVWGVSAAPAAAQAHRPAPVLEVSGVHALFLDDDAIEHAAAGASVRWYLTRRVIVGPEITYMIGPGTDRDLLVTGNVTVDLREPRGTAGARDRPRDAPASTDLRQPTGVLLQTATSRRGPVRVRHATGTRQQTGSFARGPVQG